MSHDYGPLLVVTGYVIVSFIHDKYLNKIKLIDLLTEINGCVNIYSLGDVTVNVAFSHNAEILLGRAIINSKGHCSEIYPSTII